MRAVPMFAIGRAVVGGFFVLAGISKIMAYVATGEMMAGAGIPSVLLPLVIMLETVGGAIVMLGRPARLLTLTALVLAAFTVATNIGFHRFWEVAPELQRLELSLFFKNLAIVGALFMVAGTPTLARRYRPPSTELAG